MTTPFLLCRLVDIRASREGDLREVHATRSGMARSA
jgi:hypothetical protein